MFPDASTECVMCKMGEEDYLHLSLSALLHRIFIWTRQDIPKVDVTSDKAFWSSLRGGVFVREPEWEMSLAVLWEIWQYCIEFVFKRRGGFGR